MRRFILAGVAVAVIAVGAGVGFVVTNSGGSLAQYEREAKARWAHAKPGEAPANAFRATVCASNCVLVEAAGLTFLVGAGEGAAAGLRERGLLRRDMDGVLLDDLRLASLAGLAEVGEAVLAAGRAEPLAVYGPEGVVSVVDGVNLMLSGAGDDHLRLVAGEEGANEGSSGQVVFDSGVVTIRAFPASGGMHARIYRFDIVERSLIVAGCAARADDIVAAARGARQASAVIGAVRKDLSEIERKASQAAGAPPPQDPGCMSVEEAAAAAGAARLLAALVTPTEVDSRKAWQPTATIPKGSTAVSGGPGTILDLSGDKPTIQSPP